MNASAFPLDLSGITPAELRKAVAARIEAHMNAADTLLALLDHIDGDPDFEPILGAPEAKINPPWGAGFAFSLEGNQSNWADGDNAAGADEWEETNEDGGDILDGPEWSEPIPGGSEREYRE